MSRSSLVFALSGMLFGVLVGWMIGSQAVVPPRTPAPPAAAAPAGSAGAAEPSKPGPVDEARVRALRDKAERAPKDAVSRAALGNLYFDAERYEDAITWYEEAVRLDPRDVNVSTDLGVSYYYSNQPDRALRQFEHSLAVDPNHTKTMLNVGIVRAFGKRDLSGAADAWQRVIQLAPDSPEGRAARQALDSIKGAHPGVG